MVVSLRNCQILENIYPQWLLILIVQGNGLHRSVRALNQSTFQFKHYFSWGTKIKAFLVLQKEICFRFLCTEYVKTSYSSHVPNESKTALLRWTHTKVKSVTSHPGVNSDFSVGDKVLCDSPPMNFTVDLIIALLRIRYKTNMTV